LTRLLRAESGIVLGMVVEIGSSRNTPCTLRNAVVAAKSSYTYRIRDNAAPTIERTNELSDVDRGKPL